MSALETAEKHARIRDGEKVVDLASCCTRRTEGK